MEQHLLVVAFTDRVMDGYYKQHAHGRDLLMLDLKEVLNAVVAEKLGPVMTDIAVTLESLQYEINTLKKEIQL